MALAEIPVLRSVGAEDSTLGSPIDSSTPEGW